MFVGRLVRRKGCEDLLIALGQLDSSIQESIALDIVGDGPLAKSLQRDACRLKAACVFHGNVTDSEKLDILSAADLAVFPAIGGESFGMVLLEAMSCGTPYIGYSNGGYSYVSGADSQALVDPGDVDALASAIARFMFDPAFRNQLHEQQVRRLRNFDLANVALDYIDEFSA